MRRWPPRPSGGACSGRALRIFVALLCLLFSDLLCSSHALPRPALPRGPALQRKCDAYWEAQREARWAKEVENFRNVDNEELHVGVMGLGE